MLRRLVPRKGLSDLLRNPLRRWMIGHVQRDQASPLMSQDHQDGQQPKVDRRDHKEVYGRNPGHVVPQERLPRLARSSWPTFGHVLGDRRLRDFDPELEQLTVNAWCAPSLG